MAHTIRDSQVFTSGSINSNQLGTEHSETRDSLFLNSARLESPNISNRIKKNNHQVQVRQ